MTGRLQSIEQKLTAIDPAGFQNLCDAYLILRENEYSSLNRTGSQLGKQKTILGTPDSFVRLENNRLAYIEYTTQTDSKVSKIKDDIDKCLDESKTGVPSDNVYQIIVCFNSRLTVVEEVEIQTYAESKNKRVELIGIDTLALEILSKYVLLSRDFLGIPIDTGQILPFDKFIAEYNNKARQLSTPLDNKFLHREEELEDILQHLELEDLIILSGSPGVGKTKIGIEAINKFRENHSDYTSFAISKKDVDIFEDLRIQINVDKNYILLIDDANRQISNLSQILGVFKEVRAGKIKIVITVRNYALSDIYKASFEFKNHTIKIQKFTDDEIIQIIASDSFGILNPKYQKKIVEISDGNVRLAIMAARLAKEKQTEFLWGDVSDLFDSYFDKFLTDFDLFENKTLLKTLGIISFFFTLNRDDKALTNSLLELFEINYYEFNEAIEELHKRELIEVRYNHARISEQVLATYFFYKVFIKEDLLSFKVLLFNFFNKWKTRFKDSIIPANNSFGFENVITKIDGSLSDYLKSISENEKKVLDFLDLFWFYKSEETITYFYKKVESFPEPNSPVYLTNYETNDFVYEREQTIDFLSRFFNHLSEWFKPSIELCFEFVRKKPEYLPEFIRRIRENLMFDEPDERIGFKRQVGFIDLLISKVKNEDPHYLASFFALAKSFLAHSFHVTHGGRKHTISWYSYPLPFYEATKELRTKIWNTLFECFEKYPDKVFEVIKQFKPTHQDLVPVIMDFDLGLLIPFISKKFSPENIRHTHYIHEMIYWNDREEKISDRSYRKLKQKFSTKEYFDFCKLDWNRLRDKSNYDFDDFREYDILKKEEIRKNFLFANEKEFEKLFKAILNVLAVKQNDYFSAGTSVDIVVEENFLHNNELGFKLLQLILKNYPKGLQLLYNTVKTVTSQSQDWCLKLWIELENWENENALFWRINFFNYIPDNFINEFYCEKLLKTVKSIDKYAYLYIEGYSRFNLKDKYITKTILEIISDKVEYFKITITYSDDIFEKNIEAFGSDYELIKRSYFQQYKINHSQIFDFKGKGFEQIFKIFPNFLLDFISEFYTERGFVDRNTNIKIPFIWNTDTHHELIEEALNLIIERNPYFGIGEHSVNIIFNDISESNKENIITFVRKYIAKYKDDSSKINLIFDGIRHCTHIQFEDFLLFFLSINPKLETFKNIDWAGHVGAQVGEVSFGELYAKRWEGILEIVNKSDATLAMIPIKGYLKEIIRDQYKWAESERERRFLSRDW